MEKQRFTMEDLKEIIVRLRAPGGCPWDRVQTCDSIKMSAVEEAYELVDAIDQDDDEKILEETGDILLQAVFHAVIKSALFLCAGAIIYKAGKTKVTELRGIGKEMPVTMWCFDGDLSKINFPPYSRFWGRQS